MFRHAPVSYTHLDVYKRQDLLGEALGFSVVDGEPAEIRIRRHDGERICEMRIVRMEWDDEPACLASVRDITERKQAEAFDGRAYMYLQLGDDSLAEQNALEATLSLIHI